MTLQELQKQVLQLKDTMNWFIQEIGIILK